MLIIRQMCDDAMEERSSTNRLQARKRDVNSVKCVLLSVRYGSFCAFDNPTVREIILFAHSIAADRQMYVKETRGMSVLWRMSP